MTPVSSTKAGISSTDAIASPCIGVCTLGPGDICIGCLRTSSEIGEWLNLTNLQRSQIMADLPRRLESLFAR